MKRIRIPQQPVLVMASYVPGLDRNHQVLMIVPALVPFEQDIAIQGDFLPIQPWAFRTAEEERAFQHRRVRVSEDDLVFPYMPTHSVRVLEDGRGGMTWGSASYSEWRSGETRGYAVKPACTVLGPDAGLSVQIIPSYGAPGIGGLQAERFLPHTLQPDIHLMTDQPPACPKCGARAEILQPEFGHPVSVFARCGQCFYTYLLVAEEESEPA